MRLDDIQLFGNPRFIKLLRVKHDLIFSLNIYHEFQQVCLKEEKRNLTTVTTDVFCVWKETKTKSTISTQFLFRFGGFVFGGMFVLLKERKRILKENENKWKT